MAMAVGQSQRLCSYGIQVINFYSGVGNLDPSSLHSFASCNQQPFVGVLFQWRFLSKSVSPARKYKKAPLAPGPTAGKGR
jgi:hypothetical protein